MKPLARLREDDVDLLLPSFQPYVTELRRRLVADGYDPCVRDTLRTPKEAANFKRLGTGSDKSVHIDGAAADFVCQLHHWDCDDYDCGFYAAVGRHADALRLFWGGHWRRPDRPHVQALPATRAAQNRLRAFKTWGAKDAYVLRWLRPFTPAG